MLQNENIAPFLHWRTCKKKNLGIWYRLKVVIDQINLEPRNVKLFILNLADFSLSPRPDSRRELTRSVPAELARPRDDKIRCRDQLKLTLITSGEVVRVTRTAHQHPKLKIQSIAFTNHTFTQYLSRNFGTYLWIGQGWSIDQVNGST